MKKILYLTTIPWVWIKQRPQFLAEYLATDFDVVYCYRRPTTIKKKDLIRNASDLKSSNLSFRSFRLIPFNAIPLLNKMRLDWINRLLLKCQIPAPSNYDIIWVTSSQLFNLLPDDIKNSPNIIYDCMDDLLEFPGVSGSPIVEKLKSNENYLLKKAKAVICSADYLKNKIVNRSGITPNKVTVVNNAVELPPKNLHSKLPTNIADIIKDMHAMKLNLVYIGTIDKWFDFDSILYALDKIEDMNISLFGPLRGTLPQHNRIHYYGTIPRDYIFDIMDAANVLIMPFKLNELIRSVNPVKLYEYIYACKPVIATKYGETLKFRDYVLLYDDREELVSIIEDLKEGRYNLVINENLDYIKKNTWAERYKQIKQVLLNNFKI